jgi:hypothetical protein
LSERIPEAFFTAQRIARLGALLAPLSAISDEVHCVHLDAPGYVVVDFATRAGQDEAWTEALRGPLVVEDEPTRWADDHLRVRATPFRGGLLWSWEPTERAAVHGLLAREADWEWLCERIAGLEQAVGDLLAPRGPHRA